MAPECLRRTQLSEVGWQSIPHSWSPKTVPTVYQQCATRQKQSKDTQNRKNDHWCTNRHMSTKTAPTVYQQCTNRQKQSKDSQNSKNEGLKLKG